MSGKCSVQVNCGCFDTCAVCTYYVPRVGCAPCAVIFGAVVEHTEMSEGQVPDPRGRLCGWTSGQSLAPQLRSLRSPDFLPGGWFPGVAERCRGGEAWALGGCSRAAASPSPLLRDSVVSTLLGGRPWAWASGPGSLGGLRRWGRGC